MASYTVIQDIEAEDKLLGPLSLRQFIYAVIVVVLGFVMFKLVTVNVFLVLPFLPPAILFGVLAAPFGHDQSSEIWLLAKIRFFLKPRLRIWDQGGLQELVKITAPKHVEENRTNGLDQTQVKSRLQALAQTIDTRGWAIKGVDINLYGAPTITSPTSDRLIMPTAAPAQVPIVNVTSGDDILDLKNNPVAQQMTQLVAANDQAHKQALMNKVEHARQAVKPAAIDEPLPKLHPIPQSAAYGHTPVLKPLSAIKPVAPVTAPAKPDILGLASNDDLSVATIARQANKAKPLGDDEVVVSLR